MPVSDLEDTGEDFVGEGEEAEVAGEGIAPETEEVDGDVDVAGEDVLEGVVESDELDEGGEGVVVSWRGRIGCVWLAHVCAGALTMCILKLFITVDSILMKHQRGVLTITNENAV